MSLIIDEINFNELEAEKYWSFPKNYKKDSKIETKNMIFSGDYIGARKMDGAYYRFIKDMEGNMSLQGRSRSVKGYFLDKIAWVPQLHNFFESLPNGTCLLGEIYFPNNEGSHNVTKIMGCKEDKARERQEKGEKLHYYIFDIWALDGKSFLKTNIQTRVHSLTTLMADTTQKKISTEFVEFAKYYIGKELWKHLEEIFEEGGEGIVMTKLNTHPEPGKRPARKTLKVKKEIANTIDCFFTGNYSKPTREYTGKEIETWKYWENVMTGELIEGLKYNDYEAGLPIEPVTKPYFNKWAGSLEIGVFKTVMDKSVVCPIGYLSGLADEIKANPNKYASIPIEVTAMEITEDKALRHGKFIQFRKDLTLTDCTWEKIFN